MFKIDSFGSTTGNEWQDANVGIGQPGTRITAEWMNALQRELIAILTAAGATPSKANEHQIVDAINHLISLGTGGGGGSNYWVDAVANAGALPSGKPTGSIGLSISDLTLYRYNGSAWVKFFASADYAPAASAVTLTGSQTMTNKTLTSPVINSPTGITKADVGLGSVDNTADSAKPVSGPQATALALKQDLSAKGAAGGYAGLDGTGKVPASQLPAAVVGDVNYQGPFTPASGYPASPVKGYYYIASAAGTISGVDYNTGDWAIYNGTTWDKIDNTDAVFSVDGQIGAVNLSAVYQAKDADLSSIAGLTALGILKHTAVDTYTILPQVPVADGGTGASTAIGAANTLGGLILKPISTAQTLESGYWYVVDTSAGAFTVTLPALALGNRIRISDAKETWDVNNLTIQPNAADAIGSGAVGAPYVCNVKRAWLDLAGANANLWSTSSLASSTSGVSGSGGLQPVPTNVNTTGLAYKMYMFDTSGGAKTLTLPGGTTEAVIGWLDAGETFHLNKLSLIPASGQSIFNYVADDTVDITQQRSTGVLYRSAGTAVWRGALQGVSNIASTSGEKNYVQSGANDSSGWGTSGAGITVATESTASNLAANATQKTGIRITRVSGSDYVWKRQLIDKGDYGKKFKIQEDIAYAGAAGDYTVRVFAYASSAYTGTPVELTVSPAAALPGTYTNQYQQFFDSPTAAAATPYIEVRIYGIAGTTPLYLNNFYVGPGSVNQILPVTDWAVLPGLTVANIPGTVAYAEYKRDVSDALLRFRFVASGAATGSITAVLPSFLASSQSGATLAIVRATKSGVGYHIGTMNKTSTVNYLMLDDDGASAAVYSANAPFTWASGDFFEVEMRITVDQWIGSGTNMGAGAQPVYAINSSTSVSSDTTSFSYGEQGAALQAFVPTGTGSVVKRVRCTYPNPKYAMLQFKLNGYQWINAGATYLGFSTNDAGTTFYGAILRGVSGSTTDFDVQFQSQGYPGSSWGAEASVGTLWRVVFADTPAAVGFGQATATDSGLIKPRKGETNMPFTTNLTSIVNARAVGIYYQDQDGNHRLKFNLAFGSAGAAAITHTVTLTGVTFKNVTNYTQAIHAYPFASSAYGRAYATPGSGVLVFDFGASTSIAGIGMSGDVELDSKPTWA